MPLFVIIGYDTPESLEKRRAVRPKHLARLEALHEAGRLLIGGPTPIEHGQDQMSGSVLIAEFEDLAAAELWCSQEPYLLHGVYSHVEIKPFHRVF